ncbi:cyclic pyranopterin monophosphate synthase subunit MoaA [Orenia metallireducens]|uniref:GTP 3',8-cyclase n=1 Tax=Orenia metallireducens TaxID=1413210 RepID=A0A285GH64_9FIRM|nr:GTP 3',8-cyclase MoaA [Orenia metallireducens]PRX30457.1 cyclic pyranopterin monophosphate synthase subunit MoaA [Orenia metallireducens]SNY22663.1 cyclic pyranopterin monophosphate synthase subunit MoaA [Orenia metallireducens]
MRDSYNRVIDYLRISVTDLCNLRCRYCMPSGGVKRMGRSKVLTSEEIVRLAREFVALGIKKVRITGGEPLLRPGIVDLIKSIAKIDGLEDLALTTNGLLLKEYGAKLKEAGLRRVNVSIDTLDPVKYRYITRGGDLNLVLAGLEEADRVGLTPVKLNVVLMKDFNEDEIQYFVNLTKEKEIDVRFIELMPIGEMVAWSYSRLVSNRLVLDKVKGLERVASKDKSSPAVYYKLPQGKGKVGLINPLSCKFCQNCNRVRLTADAKMKLCLHSNQMIDLRKTLRSGGDLRSKILTSIYEKPLEHDLEGGGFSKRDMFQIGG